jgi:dTDP-glucose 4,6-dehydratase
MLHKGVAGEIYNVGVDNERNNTEVAKIILNLMNKPESLLEYVEDRPGNDRRYAIDSTKITNLGWSPVYTREKFEIGMSETINWYLTNTDWVKNLWAKQEEAQSINHAPTLNKKKQHHQEEVLNEEVI